MPAGVYESKKHLKNFYDVFPTIYNDSEVVKVIPHENYTLSLWFKGNPNEERIFNFKPLIDKYDFYKPLADIDLFMTAYQQFGMVIWNDQLDMSPEWLYLDSDPVAINS